MLTALLLATAVAAAGTVERMESRVTMGGRCAAATDVLVRTGDGATIGLHHHPGVGGEGGGAPVLLVHGVSSNHRFFDLDAEHGLGTWLAARGWDTWIVDLRGHGNARRDLDGALQVSGWSVDDYGRYDVDTAVDYVRAVTGRPKVAYVGHSMGGMVAAIYTAWHGDDALSALVTLGTPASFDLDEPMVGLAQAALAVGGFSLAWFETPLFADLAAALGPWTPGRLQERLYNPDNLAPATTRAMLESVVSPMSRREMRHFSRMLRNERFESFDGTIDYRLGLAANDVPTLVFAGGVDQVVREAHARSYYEAAGGPKQFVLAADYGHLDLGLGEAAPFDIFPAVAAWLGNPGAPRASARSR
jgi:pimeloyl-ACP methyl ester carboxylesterase